MKKTKQQKIIVTALLITLGIAVLGNFIQPINAQFGFDLEDIILFLQTINPFGTVSVETESLLVDGGFRVIISCRNTLLVYMVNLRNESESGFLFDIPVCMDGWFFAFPVSEIYQTLSWLFPSFLGGNIDTEIEIQGQINMGFYMFNDTDHNGIMNESYGPGGNYTEARVQVVPDNATTVIWGNLTPIESPYFTENPPIVYRWNVSYVDVAAKLYNATWVGPNNPDDSYMGNETIDYLNYTYTYTYTPSSTIDYWELKREIDIGAFHNSSIFNGMSLASLHEHIVGRIRMQTIPVTGNEGIFGEDTPYTTTVHSTLAFPWGDSYWDMTATNPTYKLGGITKTAKGTYYQIGWLGLQENLSSAIFYGGNLEFTGNLSLYNSFVCYPEWSGATINHDPSYFVPITPYEISGLWYQILLIPIDTSSDLFLWTTVVLSVALGGVITGWVVKEYAVVGRVKAMRIKPY
jgi:hypothetical protein